MLLQLVSTRRHAALVALVQRFYPLLWEQLQTSPQQREWVRAMAQLPPREWVLLHKIEQRLRVENDR